MAQVVVFKEETIPIADIETFYDVKNDSSVNVPVGGRPYTWSMSVSTLDGLISFREPQATSAIEVAMAHVKHSGSMADWRLLNAGWMMADAVLGSGSILRSEPTIKWIPHFEDMVEYRVNVLKKPKYPLNVVLTGSGDIDLKHPMFHDADLHTVILTSKQGHEKLLQSSAAIAGTNTRIEVVGNTASFEGAEFKAASELLYEKYGVRFLDVTAGGVVIGKLMWHKLIDEMRITLAGQICGPISSTGEARPHLIAGIGQDSGLAPFTHHDNPHITYHKVALFGIHHIFIRGIVQYRHN